MEKNIIAGILLKSAGVLSALTAGGCVEKDPKPANPCDFVDCDGNGTCYSDGGDYYCVCDDGFENIGGTCIPSAYREGWRNTPAEPQPAPNPEPVEIPVDENDVSRQTEDAGMPASDAGMPASDAAAEPVITDPIERCLSLGESSCVNASTAIMCYEFPAMGGWHYKTIYCPDDLVCEDGKCVTRPGEPDPNCGPDGRSECFVTDEVDCGEEDRCSGANVIGTDLPQYRDQYLCGSDDAILLSGIHEIYRSEEERIGEQAHDEEPENNVWAVIRMQVNPPPNASYYRLDIKHDTLYGWGTATCEHPLFHTQILGIQFGDEQRVEVDKASLGEECIYQGIANFTTAGIENDLVQIQFQNLAADCTPVGAWSPTRNFIAIAKTRIWSCECR